MEQVFEILNAINSPAVQNWGIIPWIRAICVFISAFFITIVIVSITRTPYLQLSAVGYTVEIATFRPWGVPKILRRWKRILARLDRGTEAEYKLAIMESDVLLDEMLKKMRLKGDTVEERLGRITSIMIPNVEELRGAHEIRNSIVYDPDYRISLMETRRVLEVYQRTFEQLDLFR